MEGGLYGRGIIKVVPSNEGTKIEFVDTMSFLINPTATTTRKAIYCGQQFIYKTTSQLEEEADDYQYDKDVIEAIKAKKQASETPGPSSEEKTLRDLRLSYLGYANVAQLGADMVELTEWYTTIRDENDKPIKVALTVANDEYVLRAKKTKDVGLPKQYANPFSSWATYPRGVAFWTPSVADVLRDPNLAIDVTVNQQIDNNTYRNFGMIFVTSSSGLKQGSIVPRPLGVTSVTVGPDKSIKDTVWQFTPPEISSAQQTLLTLNTIADNAAGLSAATPGQKGKLNVSQQAAQSALVENRINEMRKSYVGMWRDAAQMYADCIKENLTSPRKVKVFAMKELTLTSVTKSNFDDVDFIARATPSELSQENKAIRQKAMTTIYELFKDDPRVPGQQKLREKLAREFEMTTQEIGDLFSADDEAGMMAPGQQPQHSQQQPGQQPAAQPAANGIPTNGDHTALSQTQIQTKANMPPTLK